MMAELTDSTNIAQAYAYMPIAWSTGGAVSRANALIYGAAVLMCRPQLGPVIGGFLSHPAERFPGRFGNDFFKKYPYFLPCAVPAAYSALMWLVTLLFLKDTHRSPMPISRILAFRKRKEDSCPKSAIESQVSVSDITDAEQPLSLRSLLTRKVVVAAGNYAFFAMIDVAFRVIQPLFLSTPIELGGLGLSPPEIGKILSVYGLLNGVFQMLFFARIHDRIGSKMTFMAGIVSAFPCFLAFPIISHMAKTQGLSTLVWCAVALQTLFSILMNLSFGERNTPILLTYVFDTEILPKARSSYSLRQRRQTARRLEQLMA
ncbi:hypothetical protein C0991_011274, partial [Blastosporella zonata]